MKTIILLLLMCVTTSVFAQGGGIAVKKITSTHLYTLPFPHDTTLFLRGDSLWATIGGLPYFQNDATAPILAPSVTAGTKGLVGGDSASNTAFGGIVFGGQSLNTALFGIAIGSGRAFSSSLNNGNFGIALGSATKTNSVFSFSAAGGTDNATGQTRNGQNGNNVTICDNAQNSNTTDASDITIGYDAITGGKGSTALGHFASTPTNAAAVGNVSIGLNASSNASNGKYQWLLISNGTLAASGTTPTIAHDSVFVFNAWNVVTRNAGEILSGTGNQAGSNYAFQISRGGIDGNPSAFDVISGTNDGIVTVGKAISIPGGTNGQFLQTDGSGTNVWQSSGAPMAGSIASSPTLNAFYAFDVRNQAAAVLGTSDPTDSTAGETQYAWVAPSNGIIYNFTVYVNAAPQGTKNQTLAIVKNKIVQSEMVALTAGAQFGTDLVNVVVVARGDLIGIKCTDRTGTPSVGSVTFTACFTATP